MKPLKLSALAVAFFLILLDLNGQEKAKSRSSFRDSLDNKIDISDWLVNKKGVLLVPTIITEPAVGYGGALAALYFHSSYSAKKGPPSISGAFGAYTQNGTWAGGILHAGFWKNDHIRYVGALAKTNLNLAFYGSGNEGLIDIESVNMNMDAWLLMQSIKFRLGETDFFLGGQYIYLNTDNTFEIPIDIPDYTGSTFSSTLSEVSAKFEFDSRNNVFSPAQGFFLGLNGTYSDTWLGGEALYGRIGVTMIGYLPAGEKLFVGIRHEANYTLGDVPFYARPIINLRGAPLMKYQNSNTTLFEAEVDWNFYKRWSVLGFSGIGNAFKNFAEFEEGKSVTTIGSGFRYLMARKLRTNMGMDFAFSNEDFAFYIVFGTAWMR
jgi:hypothetical protein